ncbi:MAG: hypothetical protein RRB24_10605 [Armatimonadota bacterium]|jgi:hypothetical protein|nr:hypothetical protein [Armatimonadota bacterium]MDT7973266.1 hypothetical protein [Armatimonadota bacterium]
MAKRQRWSRERIVQEIRRLHAQGIPLNMASVRRVFPSLVATACSRRYFGSWKAAIEAAGFDYDKVVRIKRWTPEEVLAEIRALYRQGADLRPSAVAKHHQTLLVAARKRFGTWAKAVKAAGIDYEAYLRQQHQEWVEADKRYIIEEIRRLYREGRIDELSGAWRHHLTLFRKARHRFGSWKAAIEAAGLNYEAIVSRRKWTKESILREIQRLYAEGKDLSVTAMQRNYPNLLAIAQSPYYFGSWQAAIEAAGLDYELIKRQRGRRRREPLRVKVTAE